MAERTAIEWTNATFNPWWGCERVSPACEHCYAETAAKRYGHDVWGEQAPRRFFGDSHWNNPIRWNRQAEKTGVPMRVFCASMADVFEDRRDLDEHRERLWTLIESTPWLTWQLLTKRPQNVLPLMPTRWYAGWPRNVWLGTTVEDQPHANVRLKRLVSLHDLVACLFVSYEPALGPVDFSQWMALLDWIICGGESGPGARPMHPSWARAVRDLCAEYGVAFFFKQWGCWAPAHPMIDQRKGARVTLDDGMTMIRLDKKRAGKHLDGRQHCAFPEQLSVPA